MESVDAAYPVVVWALATVRVGRLPPVMSVGTLGSIASRVQEVAPTTSVAGLYLLIERE
jgi:hypothetical protein